MTRRDKELMRSLLMMTTPAEAALVVGVTANTARTLKRQWHIQRKTTLTPTPPPAKSSEAVEALRARLGFATVEPVVLGLCLAYEDGKGARRRWGAAAHCPYEGEHAVAWRLGHECGAAEGLGNYPPQPQTSTGRVASQPEGASPPRAKGGMQSR